MIFPKGVQFLMQIIILSLQVLTKIYNALKIMNLGFPNYCLGHGLMDLAYNQYLTEYYTQIGRSCPVWPRRAFLGKNSG